MSNILLLSNQCMFPSKLPHVDGIAPVLMFGSAFDSDARVPMYSNMIPMPMQDVHHLDCFVHYVESGKKEVCNTLTSSNLMFGTENGLKWDDLVVSMLYDCGYKKMFHLSSVGYIALYSTQFLVCLCLLLLLQHTYIFTYILQPQVIWRGSDYTYLPNFSGQRFVKPTLENLKLGSAPNKPTSSLQWRQESAIQSLTDDIDKFVPRWKGTILTADAELKVRGTDKLAWANIKLSTFGNGYHSQPTLGNPKYAGWEALGVPQGEYLNTKEQARYKYQIDLAGVGGTTWSGFIEKLAMPGLLFHHVTPMKDYIHNHLEPWKHYIPISASLQDLKSKYDWAESHPKEAKRIADQATQFMRELGTPQGFRKIFESDFVEPFRRVIEAYQPVAKAHDDVSSWRELLDSLGGDNHRQVPVMTCSGVTVTSCKLLGGDTSPDDSWWMEIDNI